MDTKKRKKATVFQGVSRGRRPKTGQNKGMLILLTKEEKLHIEQAATKAGISMSRFIVERALQAAGSVLRPSGSGKAQKHAS
jgi:hypothetical protein